jgi:hypothetical protein
MHVRRVAGLPAEPLAAAARFYADELAAIEAMLETVADGLVVVFQAADHTHRGWRLAAIQQLARDHAPIRVNAVSSDDARAIDATVRYLAAAPGVTGQYLPLDGNGADALLSVTG